MKFYQDMRKYIYRNHVKFGFSDSKKRNKQIKLGNFLNTNRIPFGKDVKYINPRVFDGLNWWISCECIEYDNNIETSSNEGIGIDLGVKDLAICSDGITYKNINKSKEVKRLEKKKRRLQRKVSRKYIMNKKGVSYRKTYNIKKLEQELLCVSRRLTNIRHNYIHQTTSEIVNRNPMFIVMENLNVLGMIKNKHLAKAIQQQCFYEFIDK